MSFESIEPKPPIAERRPQQRKRVLMSGIVTFSEAFSFDCTFRNLSATGALVTVGAIVPFPSVFYLITIRDGIAYQAEVVRNKGTNVALRFKKRISLSGDIDPSLNYLKRLWLTKAS